LVGPNFVRALVTQKGGSGKSTLAVGLAVAAIDNGSALLIRRHQRSQRRRTTAQGLQAEFVELLGTQAPKQCELILKQAGSLRSLAHTIMKRCAD